MTLDIFRDVEKVVLSVIGSARRGGMLRVVSSYDIDAVVAAGILIRYLVQNGVGFEHVALPGGLQYKIADEVPSLVVDVEVEGPSGRIGINKSIPTFNRIGNSVVISLPYYSLAAIKALENHMVVTNDVRYYALAATLSRSTPRSRVRQVDSNVRSFVSELSDMNVIKVVRGVKIFNYSTTSISAALSSSLDMFIPGYSGLDVVRDVRGLTEEELVKEIVARLESTVHSRFSPNDLYGDVYLIAQEWLFKDAYELLYALLTLLDVYGAEYVVLAVLASSYTSFLRYVYSSVFKEVAGNAYKALSSAKEVYRVKQGVYKVRLDRVGPLTPVTKVMKSYLVPVNALIVYEVDGEYYVPASDVTDVRTTIKGDYEMVGGLIRFKELK